jgi:hypothetical protein
MIAIQIITCNARRRVKISARLLGKAGNGTIRPMIMALIFSSMQNDFAEGPCSDQKYRKIAMKPRLTRPYVVAYRGYACASAN